MLCWKRALFLKRELISITSPLYCVSYFKRQPRDLLFFRKREVYLNCSPHCYFSIRQSTLLLIWNENPDREAKKAPCKSFELSHKQSQSISNWSDEMGSETYQTIRTQKFKRELGGRRRYFYHHLPLVFLTLVFYCHSLSDLDNTRRGYWI